MFLGVAVGLTALTLAQSSADVSPPSQPGPWQQLGVAVTSKPGKTLHFYRAAQNPKALGLVARSSSARPIHVFWWSYCEFESDDAMTGETQDSATAVHRVVAYPPVLDKSTLCYVWVNARVSGNARVTAAVFSY